MATAWPADVPYEFERNSYAEGRVDNRVRSPTDAGPEKTRPRTSRTLRTFAGSILMSSAELDRLDTLYDTTLASGSLPVELPVPREPDADPRPTVRVRFVEPHEATNVGGDLYEVSVTLVEV